MLVTVCGLPCVGVWLPHVVTVCDESVCRILTTCKVQCVGFQVGHARQQSVDRESSARFDLLQPQTFETFLNCTVVNDDQNAILETITLPF